MVVNRSTTREKTTVRKEYDRTASPGERIRKTIGEENVPRQNPWRKRILETKLLGW